MLKEEAATAAARDKDWAGGEPSSRNTIHDNYTSLAAYSSPVGGEQRVSDCYNVDKYGKLAVFSSRIWQRWPPGSRGDSQRR